MIGRLALIGLICAAFGLASYRMLGEFWGFSGINLALGAAALLAAIALGLARTRRDIEPGLRRQALSSLGRAGLICGLAGALFAASLQLDRRFDWTFEGNFRLSQATAQLLGRLPAPLQLVLYYSAGDPRIRRSRLLLEEFAAGPAVEVSVLDLAERPEDEDRFGIGSSNSVVVKLAGDWALVPRPSEGTLYEAISGLVHAREATLYTAAGAGEGDLEKTGDTGYSGLRAALETEGYELRPLPLSLVESVPSDADGLLIIGPKRRLPGAATRAVEDFIDRGGRLIAFLEPGLDSGLEALLARYGITSPNTYVVDPASAPTAGEPLGLNPVVSAYTQHPVTRGLENNRTTFFRRVRPLQLRKAQPDDKLRSLVFSSGEAWTDPNALQNIPGVLPEPPPDAGGDYQTLVAVAEIERSGPASRLVVFGNAVVASNRDLRALYNLDLVLNAIHWALEREPQIALRPKTGGRQVNQFPVPLQSSLKSLYGLGLLVPELLLIAAGLVWLRARST